MLFLILLCSLISPSLAESNNAEGSITVKSVELSELRAALTDCNASLIYLNMWESLGIRRRDYRDGKFQLNLKTEKNVERLLERFEKLTLRQSIDLAKEEFPELTRDIENYIALETRDIFVYTESVWSEYKERIRCITNDECKINISKEEALFLLDKYETKILSLRYNLGQQTTQSFLETLELIDKSEILGLKCNYDCVREEYEQWTAHCTKPNQPWITEASHVQSDATDSTISAN